MQRSQASAREGARSASPLLVNDLCAQLVPLNRYGLNGVASALVSALRALTGASRTAVCAATGSHRA